MLAFDMTEYAESHLHYWLAANGDPDPHRLTLMLCWEYCVTPASSYLAMAVESTLSRYGAWRLEWGFDSRAAARFNKISLTPQAYGAFAIAVHAAAAGRPSVKYYRRDLDRAARCLAGEYEARKREIRDRYQRDPLALAYLGYFDPTITA
jgi:hypothetical protein